MIMFMKSPLKPDEQIVVFNDTFSGRKLSRDFWDTVVSCGLLEGVKILLEIKPELARSLNKNCYTPLHIDCWSGNLEIVKEFTKVDPELCLVKYKHGRTPLHTAAMRGRLDIMRELLDACRQSVTEVTSASETLLHVAISHDQVKAVRLLVQFLIEEKINHDVINRKDCIGNTVLHIATSRKQLQSLKYFLLNGSDNSVVEVNALNDGGFTALDILDVLPQHGKIDMEIEKILHRAGCLRARDLRPTCKNCYNVSKPPKVALLPTLSLSSRNECLSSAALSLIFMMAGLGLTCLSPIVTEQKYRNILPLMSVPFVSFLLSVMVMETIKKSPISLWPFLLISVFSLLAYLCFKMAYLTPSGVTLRLGYLDNFWIL